MTAHSNWIYEYLTATRKVYPEKIRNRYSLIKAFVENTSQCSRPAKLILTYSTMGSTEIVMNNEEAYLVYDQFAGDCFAAFNWLMMTQEAKRTPELFDLILGQKLTQARATRPMLKYLAQLMLERQEFPWDVATSPRDSAAQDGLLVQETFAICHEYAHHILHKERGIRDAAWKCCK